MTEYFRVEINGDAQSSAKLIHDLRDRNWNLFVDQQGYLVVAESEWERLDQLAQQYHCQLESLGQYRQAA